MDMKTGEVYEGEPRNGRSVPVDVEKSTATVLEGPFAGRRYEVVGGKRGRRVRPDATAQELALLRAKRDAARLQEA